MRCVFKIILFVLVTNVSFGQGQLCKQDLFPKQSTNRYWGYVNIFGEWQITPIFTTASPFRGKTAVVLRGMKYGVVNCDGRIIIPFKYDGIQDFVGGKTWVRKDGLWGLVNDVGTVLLEPLYSDIVQIATYSDQVWVKNGAFWGVYDFDRENFLYEPQFSELQVLDDIRTLVRKDELSGIIRTDTVKYVYPMQIEKVVKLAPYRLAVEEKKLWGILTYTGNLLAAPQYDTLFFKQNNLIQVEKGDKIGLVDYIGRLVTPLIFDSIADFSQGGARVCSNQKCGFISVRGKLVVPIELIEADKFVNGLCIAKKEEGYGLINAKNEWIVLDTFDLIEPAINYRYYVGHDGSKRLFLNSKGDIISDQIFFFIDLEGRSDLVRVQTKGYHLYDFTTDTYVSTISFDSIGPQNHQVFIYQLEGKYGVLDTSGKIRVENLYDDIKIINKQKQYFITQENGKWGMRFINKVLITNDSDSLFFLDKNYLLSIRDGLQGVFYKSGKKIIDRKYEQLTIVERSGKLVWPIVYHKRKNTGLVNNQGIELKLPKHQEILFLENRLYGYQYNGKWGVLNDKGKLLIEAKFDELGTYESGLLPVKVKGEWVVVNKQGVFK